MKPGQEHPWREVPVEVAEKRGPGCPKGHDRPAEIECRKLFEAFKKCGLSKGEIARRMGWMKRVPNIHRVSLAFGTERDSTGKIRKKVTYQTAKRLVEIMGASPYDVGL